MKPFFLFCFLILLAPSSFSLLSASDKVLLEKDTAVFRLQGEVIFLFDITQMVEGVKLFSQSHPSSLLFEMLEWKAPFLEMEEGRASPRSLEKVLSLYKLLAYMKNQKRGASESALEALDRFLNFRFNESVVVVGEEELALFAKKNPQKSKEELQSLYRPLKKRELMQQFLQSLHRQMEHTFFLKE